MFPTNILLKVAKYEYKYEWLHTALVKQNERFLEIRIWKTNIHMRNYYTNIGNKFANYFEQYCEHKTTRFERRHY